MEDFMGSVIAGILLSILFIVVIALIIRAIVLWYWKVNERLYEMQRTNKLLLEIRDLLEQGNAVSGLVGNEVIKLNNKVERKETLPDL